MPWNQENQQHMQANFLNLPFINNIITDIKAVEAISKPWECDYAVLSAALFAIYFPLDWTPSPLPAYQWVIVPEYNHLERNHPDFTLFKVGNNNPSAIDIHAVFELKSRSGDSWYKLLEQMYGQADVAKNPLGRLWAVGQKGLEICFFNFDVLKNEDEQRDEFTSFDCLNLHGFSAEDLKKLGVAFLTTTNKEGSTRIAVIKWRLDDIRHQSYIHDMFIHIKNNDPYA